MPEGPGAATRGVTLVVAITLAIVLIGLVTGTSPSTYQAERAPERTRPDPGPVPPARTHAELAVRPWGADPAASGWSEAVQTARDQAPPHPEAGESVEAALRDRSTRRAFDGAPPVVPHPIRDGGASECLACHGAGFELGRARAGGLPHPAYASCTQCHVASAATFAALPATAAAEVRSGWQGLEAPRQGERAYPGAPPSVPHAIWMRGDCNGCHGPQGRAALRTPHPGRQSCLQCHPATGAPSQASAR